MTQPNPALKAFKAGQTAYSKNLRCSTNPYLKPPHANTSPTAVLRDAWFAGWKAQHKLTYIISRTNFSALLEDTSDQFDDYIITIESKSQ